MSKNPDHPKYGGEARTYKYGEKDLGKLGSGFSPKRRDHVHEDPPLILRPKKRRRVGNNMPMTFVSLHHHSTFSYLDGFQMPEAHVRRAEELNMNALAMTEHGNMSSHVKLEVACEKSGVKPIYGVELYCGEIDEEHRTQRKNHLTLLATNDAGYRNLLQLVSRTYSEGFYYEPTADGQMLADHRDGVVVLSGCQGSLLFTSLLGGKNIAPEAASYRRAKQVARSFKATFDGKYFIEVQAFPELDATCRANPLLAQIARELKIPLVASMDVHYTDVTEREMQQILHNVRGGGRKSLEDQAREWGYEACLAPPASDRAIYRRLRGTGLSHRESVEAILNTEGIAEQCSVVLPKLPAIRYPLPPGATRGNFWQSKLDEGWRFRGFDNLRGRTLAQAKAQLRKERRIIEAKDFTDYFLVVSDAVAWAKDQSIAVGPARGSAAASLVCYLLRITEVNPLLYPNLVFERFIDTTREDLPDIDLDFDSERRGEVRSYLVSKYGAECVNNIGTFSGYKAKAALDDVARVFKIPKYEVDTIKELLIERSSGDLRASATIEDTVEYFENARAVFEKNPELRHAVRLEGNVKGFGIHAAGLVVSNGPITDVASVIERVVNGDRRTVVAMDKYDAERQGLLKLDFLGLATITMLAESCRQIDMPFAELYNLPTDDPKVIQGFRSNDVVGIFQFEGRATRTICGALGPDDFNEVCDIIALSRPGPLHNGASGEYIDIKRGLKEPERLHPLYDPIAATTKFQLVYQEQILRIVREIGAFSWTHAAYIRKIISRKIGDAEFNRQWSTFLAGAQKNGVPEDIAKKIWGMCITAGSYSFNYAHTVSYALLGYWSMWFKVYHPGAFYAAALAKMNKGEDQGSGDIKVNRHINLMRDAAARGIEILPPNIRRSDVSWRTAGKRRLRAGLTQIPGIGEKMAIKIIEERARTGIRTWEGLSIIRGVGPKTILKMREFAEKEDPFNIHAMTKLLDKTKACLGELGLPAPTHTAIEVPYERGPDLEVVWVGVILDRNLRDLYEINRARTGEELKPEEVKDPDLNEWVVMHATDGTELLTLRIDRWTYPRYKSMVWKIKPGEEPIVIRGYKPGWQNNRVVTIRDLWVVDPDG